MKLVIATSAAVLALSLAAVPSFAQSDSATLSGNTTVTAPQDNPNVDPSTAAADTARQNFYQDKLNAAQAQAQADSAVADRNAAQLRADQDKHQIEENQ